MILRVFIVEDEEMIRKGLVHTINWAGMGCLVVGSAADGRSGLSSILQKRPDVVITISACQRWMASKCWNAHWPCIPFVSSC